MRTRLALALLGALGACGEPSAPPAATARPPSVATLIAQPAGPDDVIVARVDGRPVYGSCVAAQAAGDPARRQVALDECIALELAAQEAERRGLDRDPDVGHEATRALVARFLDRELTAKIRTAADLPPAFVEPLFRKQAWRMHRAEYRMTAYARLELGKDQIGTPADRAAEQVARAAYTALAGRKDLFLADVEAALRAAAGPSGLKVSAETPSATTRDAVLQKYYRDAVFALAEVGDLAPPVRGPYGWDLILYTGQVTPLESTREQVLDQLFGQLRIKYFDEWSKGLLRGHEVTMLADDETLRQVLGGEEASPP